MLPMGHNSGGGGKIFSIGKTYFLQVKRLILVGTLEKCALILKSSSIVGLVMNLWELLHFIKNNVSSA
ncbi:hypothetical protein LEP1GSC021_4193 [Leptospira noguchii str. 1993005606]|nr:hypothetical protein LEP1GSC021_4193 [Leptospira noguchii str. 1993005606]